MKRVNIVGLIIVLAATSLSFAKQPEYKPGSVIVLFKDAGTSTAAKNNIINAALKRTGDRVKSEFSVVKGLTLVQLPADINVENAITALRQSSSVVYAVPNYKREKLLVPNDTSFSKLWAMRNTGQTGGMAGADISAVEAWDFSTGSSDIIVAVTDTGTDYTHQDLADNIWHNPSEIPGNGVDDDSDGYIDDYYGVDTGDNDGDPLDDSADPGHGTHVSGTIGAVGNNNTGVTGVCWNVKIMAVKIADANGDLWDSAAIDGIEFAVNKGVKVINASWGGSGFNQALYDVIASARDAGILFVAAAGNNNGNNDASPIYPAAFNLDNIISVMATDNTDQRSYYSNYGLTSVDLGAPGGAQQYIGDPRGIYSTIPGNQYDYYQGTSMASPHVAGACALLLSIEPTLTYSQVRQILLDTVDETLPGLCVSGGRMNLGAAAQEAAVDSTPPTPTFPQWATGSSPKATGLRTVIMRASAVTDRSGVEYYFECVNDVNKNSGWTANTLFSLTTLDPGTTYGFHFKARDKSAGHNETDWSTTVFTTTSDSSDNLSPFPDPPQWLKPPVAKPRTNQIRMIAGTGYDESGPVEYQFQYQYSSNPAVDVNWQSSNLYDFNVPSSDPTILYNFRFRVRDANGNETDEWSKIEYARMFSGARILNVPTIDYPTIQDAIDAADDGDTVVVSPYPYPPYYYVGVWYGNWGNINLRFYGKAITVRSIDPTDPDVVAATIIDCVRPDIFEDPEPDPEDPRRAFIFDHGEGPDSVVAGFTIRNCYVKAHEGSSPEDAAEDVNGGPGYTAAGGAILCGPNPDPCFVLGLPDWHNGTGSPTIRNCVFLNCIVEGGDGGAGADGNDGDDADPEAIPPIKAQPGQDGGHGGAGGNAFGGAIYSSSGSSPVILDCTFIKCRAIAGEPNDGGDGGDGGEDTDLEIIMPGGNGGDGGGIDTVAGGAIYASLGGNPEITGCDIIDCNAILNVERGVPGQPGEGGAPPALPGYMRGFGTASGGGVYYAVDNNSVNISSTTFSENLVRDAMRNDIYDDAYGGGICLDVNGTGIITFSDCDLTGNWAEADGGGIFSAGATKMILSNCRLTDNFALIDGGGVLSYSGILDVYDSDFTGNMAGYGGAMFNLYDTLTIQNSSFQGNQAQEGGAIGAIDCNVGMTDCRIINNSAIGPNDISNTGIGGGMTFWNTYGKVTNCTLMSNSADDSGGAVFVAGWTTSPMEFINCLFTDNTAYYSGGGIFANMSGWARIYNGTFVNNSTESSVYGSGGAVDAAENFAWIELYNSILWDNSSANGSQIAAGTALGSSQYGSDPFADVDVAHCDVEGGEDALFIEDPFYTWVWWLAGNITDDPLFVDVDINEPGYYLSQVKAGQATNSPCVDAGGFTASELNFLVGQTLTTRTDSVEDANTVDIGYHYKAGIAKQYNLTIDVYKFDPNEGGHGRLTAQAQPGSDYQFSIQDTNTIQISQATEVNLIAAPDPCFKVQYWSGTDNDGSTALTNAVTMNSDKKVVVAFAPDGVYYLTVTVIGNGTVTPLGRTLHSSGEVVTLTATPDNPLDKIDWTGTDNDASETQTNTVTMDTHKNVTVEFYTPRILQVGGDINYPNIQMAIDDANDRDIVLITAGTYNIVESSQDHPYLLIDGKDITITTTSPENPEATVITGKIMVYNVSRKCVIQGLTIRGNVYWDVDLFDPINEWGVGTPQGSGLDGPPAPWTYGSGMTLNGSASPTIRNVRFEDCVARGIHGADGAGGEDELRPGTTGNGGPGGRAMGGGAYCGADGAPLFVNCSFTDCLARGGDAGNGAAGSQDYIPGHGGAWGDKDWPYWDYGPMLDYWRYTGCGGAVYCDEGSTAEFINCNFTDNTTIGTSCGISGTPVVMGWPYSHYKIQSFGGAVYAATGSAPTFTDCNFTDNMADPNGWPTHRDNGETVAAYPITSYGGAIAFETGASPLFNKCTFTNNLAAAGGAVYCDESYPEFDESSFVNNTALHGGGLMFSEGYSIINRCYFAGNEGTYQAAQGGAISALGANGEITDCNINNNRSAGSGGGIYVSSRNIDGTETPGGNSVLIKNCLIINNAADLGGGGVAAVWYSDPNIVNCTIYNNSTFGIGGGLLSSYGSFTNVINSIIYGNFAIDGSQIAVGTIDTNSPVSYPSTAKVMFSDVNGIKLTESEGIDANAVPVIRAGFDTIELAGNDDGSTGLVDIGFAINFFGRQYSQLYVNNNGNVTFDANMWEYTPFGLTGNIGTPIIAPFFADVDTSVGNITAFGPSFVGGHNAFGVTWTNVGYYFENTDKTNTFQMLIIDRSDRGEGDFDIEFNYESIQWETGDASGGNNGFDGQSARVGFSNGTGNSGTFYEFTGSGVPGSFLDSGPAATRLISNSRSSVVPGRYIFTVRGGLPALLTSVPFYVSPDSNLMGFRFDTISNDWIPEIGSGNIDADPCFVIEVGYFLSQFAAGQPIGNQSPCVDAGSADADTPGIDLANYTTRTDSVGDQGIVDMGYHYPFFTPPQYRLDINVVEGNGLTAGNVTPVSGLFFDWYRNVPLEVNVAPPENFQIGWEGTNNDDSNDNSNNILMDGPKTVTVAFVSNVCTLTTEVINGHGTISVSPEEPVYTRNTVVTLTAIPDAGYRIKAWTGTDNDSSFALTNSVTMAGDKHVTVEFEVPSIKTVPGDYTTIQGAVNAARTGDIVSVATGVYNEVSSGEGGAFALVVNKEITITSTNPDDPCVVAMTVIDGSEKASRGVIFGAGATGQTVLKGITIANCGYSQVDRDDADEAGQPGPDGYGSEGGGILVQSGASPTIMNCIIRNCNIFGGNAGAGGNADATTDAGHGGWAGWARGAGIYVASNANPTFINCTITDNTATGGNGGNGGNYAEDGGRAGYGGNWSDGLLWETWGYIGDYRFYSGYGAGVFCDEDSLATFNACNIINNTASGGLSGIGGNREAGVQIPPPDTAYRLPGYGGGVYCGKNSNIEFVDCNIKGNLAPKPDDTYHTDPYLGHGGGIAFEDTANVSLTRCNISDNISAVGGGMFWLNSEPVIRDCNIFANIAYVGGGIFGQAGAPLIENCNIYSNFAGISTGDVDVVAGQGGGIFSESANANIIDCRFVDNITDASGAGIYFHGPASGGSSTANVTNCLLIGNTAGRDGGGISANWNISVDIANCTLHSNNATGDFGDPNGHTGLGGGLYCAYGAITNVIDSILWRNDADFGPEIAVDTGFELDPHCGSVSVSYSDVRGGSAGVYIGEAGNCGANLTWGSGNIGADPRFVSELISDYHLQHISAGQMVTSPCVEKGSTSAVNAGLALYTTRTDEVPDRGIVDMGYHYLVEQPCRFVDIGNKILTGDRDKWMKDGIIDWTDFIVLADAWLSTSCSPVGDWCHGADLTFNGIVNWEDLALISQCWLASDETAPSPSPSQWRIYPTSVWPDKVKMAAVDTIDRLWGLQFDSTHPVKYFFQCTSGNGHSSGTGDPNDPNDPNNYQYDADYTDTGLQKYTEYAYRVRARDLVGNMTEWSSVQWTVISPDSDPPTPNPMTWEIEPNAVPPSSISMRATTAADDSGGIRYEFEFSDPNGSISTSGWRDAPDYDVNDLDPEGPYCFRVRAQDAFDNETDWSNQVCVSNLGDATPPEPAPTIIWFEFQWDGGEDTYERSCVFRTTDLRCWHRVVADVTGITDDSGGPLELRFICDADDNPNSPFNSTKKVGQPIIIDQPPQDNIIGGHDTGDTYQVFWTGNTIVYDVYINTSTGWGDKHIWQVCVYDPTQNKACSDEVEINKFYIGDPR